MCSQSKAPVTLLPLVLVFFFSSRRRHTICGRDWSSDVCSSDLSGVDDVAILVGNIDDGEHVFTDQALFQPASQFSFPAAHGLFTDEGRELLGRLYGAMNLLFERNGEVEIRIARGGDCLFALCVNTLQRGEPNADHHYCTQQGDERIHWPCGTLPAGQHRMNLLFFAAMLPVLWCLQYGGCPT